MTRNEFSDSYRQIRTGEWRHTTHNLSLAARCRRKHHDWLAHSHSTMPAFMRAAEVRLYAARIGPHGKLP